MPRYKLRTLLIVLALGPPLIAGVIWGWKEWRWRVELRAMEERLARARQDQAGYPDPAGDTWDAEAKWQRYDATVKAEKEAAYQRAVEADRRRQGQPPPALNPPRH